MSDAESIWDVPLVVSCYAGIYRTGPVPRDLAYGYDVDTDGAPFHWPLPRLLGAASLTWGAGRDRHPRPGRCAAGRRVRRGDRLALRCGVSRCRHRPLPGTARRGARAPDRGRALDPDQPRRARLDAHRHAACCDHGRGAAGRLGEEIHTANLADLDAEPEPPTPAPALQSEPLYIPSSLTPREQRAADRAYFERAGGNLPRRAGRFIFVSSRSRAGVVQRVTADGGRCNCEAGSKISPAGIGPVWRLRSPRPPEFVRAGDGGIVRLPE